MKAISIHQPYASALVHGAKTIETRTWNTNYRGLVLIHATAKRDERELSKLEDRPEWIAALRPIYPHKSFAEALPFGCIVGIGRLECCLPAHKFTGAELYTNRTHPGEPPYPHWCEAQLGNFGPNSYGWVFRELEALAVPVTYKGSQGLWNVTPEFFLGRIPMDFFRGAR